MLDQSDLRGAVRGWMNSLEVKADRDDRRPQKDSDVDVLGESGARGFVATSRMPAS